MQPTTPDSTTTKRCRDLNVRLVNQASLVSHLTSKTRIHEVMARFGQHTSYKVRRMHQVSCERRYYFLKVCLRSSSNQIKDNCHLVRLMDTISNQSVANGYVSPTVLPRNVNFSLYQGNIDLIDFVLAIQIYSTQLHVNKRPRSSRTSANSCSWLTGRVPYFYCSSQRNRSTVDMLREDALLDRL